VAKGAGAPISSYSDCVLAVVRRKNVIQYWLNGIHGGTDGDSATTIAQTATRIGTYDGIAGEALAGRLYEMCIFNQALSDEEIREVSADPFGMFRPRRRVYGVASNRRRRLLLCGAV
jgi:hypothetical protein